MGSGASVADAKKEEVEPAPRRAAEDDVQFKDEQSIAPRNVEEEKTSRQVSANYVSIPYSLETRCISTAFCMNAGWAARHYPGDPDTTSMNLIPFQEEPASHVIEISSGEENDTEIQDEAVEEIETMFKKTMAVSR